MYVLICILTYAVKCCCVAYRIYTCLLWSDEDNGERSRFERMIMMAEPIMDGSVCLPHSSPLNATITFNSRVQCNVLLFIAAFNEI